MIPPLALIEMMQQRFHGVVALLLVMTGLAQGAPPRWLKLRSANFELFTSAGERAGRQTIQQFERTRAVFRQALPWVASDSEPARILLFRSEKEYLPFRLGEAADAYYLSGLDTDLIVLVAGNESSTAIHEYVHLLVRRSELRLPLWINEGLAEFYATMQQVGGKLVVGGASPGRMMTLRRENWVPLEQVLLADHDSQHYTAKKHAGRFYAESWALTHMLMLSQEYRPKVTELFRLLNDGTPSVTALETVYGISIEQLHRELQSYVRPDRLNIGVLDIKLQKSAERPSTEQAEELEVGLLLAGLLANTKKTEEARAMYEKVSGGNPEAPGPHEGLGLLAYRLGNKDQARIHFGRAFELGSNSPRMLRRYAGLQREADDKNIVLTLRRAVAASPEDVEMKLALGSHFLQRDSYVRAVGILEQVRNANAEQAKSLLRMLAYARLKLNHRESGQQAARQLLELARTPDEIEYAQNLLAHLQRDTVDVSDVRPASQDGPRYELGEREAKRIPDDTPVSPPTPQKLRPREETSTVAGWLVRLHCLGDQARMDLAVGGETVSLLIDDGGRVDLEGSDGARVDLHCGDQDPRSVVVRFVPSENAEQGTQGVVRSIEFTGPAN